MVCVTLHSLLEKFSFLTGGLFASVVAPPEVFQLKNLKSNEAIPRWYRPSLQFLVILNALPR